MSRILIADDVEGLKKLSRILDGEDLRFGHTTDEALFLLDTGPFDLIIVDIHFDESRAIEFMMAVRNNEKTKNTPLVFVRTKATSMAPELKRTIELLQHAVSIDGFIECEELDDNEQQIREALLHRLHR